MSTTQTSNGQTAQAGHGMSTLRQEHSRDAAYFGDNPKWLIVCAVNRDSDALARSNFRVASAALNTLPAVKEWAGEFSPVTVERSSHWACGWVDYLVIDPACPEAVECAVKMHARLENYPVLDEEDWGREEAEEAETIWAKCYDARERVAYIRKASLGEFEFRSFADLLSCVRGKYFAGYASELCSR